MASSSLQDFVKEQKNRNSSSFSKLQSGFDDLRSKLSVNGSKLPFSAVLFGNGDSTDPDSVGVDSPNTNGAKANGPESSWKLSDNAFGLSRTQRFVGFFMCLTAGASCFGLALMYIPVLVFKARKFAALYTLGSCFFIFSFALLWGPVSYGRHLCSQPRLPVTLAYFFTLSATLYCSLWINSTVLTVICAGTQLVALVWFLLSYIPGGETGLKFMSRICGAVVRRKATTASLPV